MALDTSVRLSCARGSTSHRARNIYALTSGMKASCANCGAPFIIIAMPTTLPDNEASLHAVSEVPDPGLLSIEQDAAPAEDAQRLGSNVTLGIYYYWAKIRVRTYLFGQTEFAGDRFMYHGSARELLNGTMKASLVFGVPYFQLKNAGNFLEANMGIQIALQVAASLLLVLFIPVAIASSRRYRLSRTAWRGIRFSFQGKTLDFIKLWFAGCVLTGLTLGLHYPYFSTKKHAFLTAHSYFGNESFKFSGDGAMLFRPFLRMYLLAVTIAIVTGLSLYSFIELPLQNF